MTPATKSWTAPVILLLMILVLVACGSQNTPANVAPQSGATQGGASQGGAANVASQDDPAPIAEKYLRAVAANDLADLQETADPDQREQVIQSIALQMGLSSAVGGAESEYTELNVTTVSNDGQRASVRATGKFKTKTLGTQVIIPVDIQIPMVKKQGRWYVTAVRNAAGASGTTQATALPKPTPDLTKFITVSVAAVKKNLNAEQGDDAAALVDFSIKNSDNAAHEVEVIYNIPVTLFDCAEQTTPEYRDGRLQDQPPGLSENTISQLKQIAHWGGAHFAVPAGTTTTVTQKITYQSGPGFLLYPWTDIGCKDWKVGQPEVKVTSVQ